MKKTIKIADLVIDSPTLSVKRGIRKINLSFSEFTILRNLIMNSGRTLTNKMILRLLSLDEESADPAIAEYYVRSLQEKIDSGFKNKLIMKVNNLGYALKT